MGMNIKLFLINMRKIHQELSANHLLPVGIVLCFFLFLFLLVINKSTWFSLMEELWSC